MKEKLEPQFGIGNVPDKRKRKRKKGVANAKVKERREEEEEEEEEVSVLEAESLHIALAHPQCVTLFGWSECWTGRQDHPSSMTVIHLLVAGCTQHERTDPKSVEAVMTQQGEMMCITLKKGKSA
ncbi:uncharacterized protein MONOS_13646 [Monocercomonoides exilis]|uniref:uncharacterized protein n=1 Tax=Monocercomonoides exilis TaxID=2049356 RepID=UPI00355AC630|nr:hypothetical protein MONOS_13646 [Monocercomonoides exilis]|eukprot:MONOS_13646.1-p1 / transcript=MONOS_13646.1 / gene=MONOS_13646 / organism=Monocercomonoides_exilis_PA203 / gene_product=unspecified product / transcript_product=unspecified product / location=Mono_scaffold00857:25644-26018(+) / protein_length=125 / sequence_SO=supercontig / SO=protein_coding / is_pseudo=false